MNIKAAIFDMDGTLVDSLGLWDVFWERLGSEYRNDKTFKPSAEDDKAVRTIPLRDAMNLLHEHYQLGRNGEEVLHLVEQIIVDFYSQEVELKKGVKVFLEYCKKNGVKMCVASATAMEHLSLVLKHCDIESYFSKVFSCDVLGIGKDRPDVFLLAKEYLGTEPEETWVFEDSIVAIETATKLGMPTVGIYDQHNPYQDEIRKIATKYIAQGEDFTKLI